MNTSLFKSLYKVIHQPKLRLMTDFYKRFKIIYKWRFDDF